MCEIKTKNNDIIHDIHTEDQKQVDNVEKIGFELGIVHREYETFDGLRFGKAYYYIESGNIRFPLSEESFDAIAAKTARLRNIKKEEEKYDLQLKRSSLLEEIDEIDRKLGERKRKQ